MARTAGGSAWRGRALALLLGAALPLLFRLALPPSALTMENSDYRGAYEPEARNILAGRGPVVENGNPMVRYPPGYPYLLAGVFRAAHALNVSEGAALLVFSVATFALACLLIFEIAARVWPWPSALLAPLGLATYPLALWVTKQPNTESPFMPLLYGSILFFGVAIARKERDVGPAVAAGILAGAALIVRPAAIALGFVLAALILAGLGAKPAGRRAGLAAILLLGSFSFFFPWQLWLHARTGEFAISGSAGAIRDGLTFAGSFVGTTKQYRGSVKLPSRLVELERDIQAQAADIESTGDAIALMRKEFGQRPLAVVQFLAWKLVRSWYGTDSLRYERPILGMQVVYAIVFVAALFAAWRRGGSGARALAIVVLGVVFYFWGMTFLALSIVRYMVPAIGLLFALLPALVGKRAAAPSSP